MEKKMYPEGHFVGLWMGICMAITTVIVIPVCIIADMISFMALGPAFGVGIGVAVGGAVEAKYKKQGQIIPKTEEQKKRAKTALTISFVVLLALLIAAVILWMK